MSNVEFIYASLRLRLVAFLIDLSFAAVTSVGGYFVFDGKHTNIKIDFIPIVVFFYFLLNTISYFQTRSKSIGENFMKIKVINFRTGLNPSMFSLIFRLAFLSTNFVLMYYGSSVTWLLLLTFILLVFIKPYSKTKRLGWDICCNTAVVIV